MKNNVILTALLLTLATASLAACGTGNGGAASSSMPSAPANMETKEPDKETGSPTASAEATHSPDGLMDDAKKMIE